MLERVESVRIDATTGRIPVDDWGTLDLVVCLGGDGVILHASKLFQGPVPPLLGRGLHSSTSQLNLSRF